MLKIQIFKIWHKTLHATHLLKLRDKMYKYEMDPTKTVGATEWTRDAGGTDGWTDGVKPIYPPINLSMLALKLNHVSKRALVTWKWISWHFNFMQ